MKNNMKNDKQGNNQDHQGSQTSQKSQLNQKSATGKNTKDLSASNQNEERESDLGRTKRDHNVSSGDNTKTKGNLPNQPNRGGTSAHR